MRLPPWLRARSVAGPGYLTLKGLIRRFNLHTVCEEARCPNIYECWNAGTATVMILGETCTRSCGFCAVATGRPAELDHDEPVRVARAIATLGLRHVVITSVNRDELDDGGAAIFADTIRRTRAAAPGCAIEVLIPDFQGSPAALTTVLDARPDILNHNLETVPRLYPRVRPQAKYGRSLGLLAQAKRSGMTTKTGIMVGLGETRDELRALMADVVRTGCDMMTAGQYLRPSLAHLPVERYYPPEEFAELRDEGMALGIPNVFAGPLVRSSYHAAEQVRSSGDRPTSSSRAEPRCPQP